MMIDDTGFSSYICVILWALLVFLCINIYLSTVVYPLLNWERLKAMVFWPKSANVTGPAWFCLAKIWTWTDYDGINRKTAVWNSCATGLYGNPSHQPAPPTPFTRCSTFDDLRVELCIIRCSWCIWYLFRSLSCMLDHGNKKVANWFGSEEFGLLQIAKSSRAWKIRTMADCM